MIAAILSDILMTLAGIAAIAVAANLRRRPREPDQLEPNCVLTRYPVEFWTGRRTIFHFRETWGDLVAHLFAHGYDARTVRLPWMGKNARLRVARARLTTPKHLVLDWATAEEFEVLLRESPPLSLTVLDPVPESALDRLCFAAHAITLRVLGTRLRARKPVDGDPRSRLLTSIRRLAEEDWREADADADAETKPDFPLEAPTNA